MKADSGDEEEDSKPPARDTKTMDSQQGQGTGSAAQRKRSEKRSGETGRSLKKPPPGAQNVASLPKKRGAAADEAGSSPGAKKRAAKKSASPAADAGSSSRAKRPRQKTMDEDAPANETAEERRLRRNRINDRRKRARRAMKVDFLNEQYENLKAQNVSIKQQNQTLREQISAVRRAMGMEDAPATQADASGQALTDEAGEAASADGQRNVSGVLSSVVRSRLDGSILAALNRQLGQQQQSSPSLSATSERPAQVTSVPPSRQVQGGEFQASSGGALSSFHQQQGGSGRASAAPSPQEMSQVARRGSDQEPQGQAMASLMASLLNRQQQQVEGGATGVGETAASSFRRSQTETAAREQESFSALLSSLQQQQQPANIRADPAPASYQRSLTSSQSTGGQAHHQGQGYSADIEPLRAILQGQQQPSTDSTRGRSSSTSRQTSDISALLLQQLESTRASGNSSRDSVLAGLRQQLRDGRTQEENRPQGRTDFNMSQDQLSEFLRRRDGSFDEAQGTTRRQQTMEHLLRSVQERPSGESSRSENLLAAFQDLLRGDSASNQRLASQLQSQNPGSAIYALVDSLHDDTRGGPTGSASSARQQDQSDELRALLQMYQSRSSGQQQGMALPLQRARDDNARTTPELLAALQQLQGGGNRDRTGSFQSQTDRQARQSLSTFLQARQGEHQGNQDAERMLTSLQRQQSSGSGNETVEDILRRLQQQQARGSAPSPSQPDMSSLAMLLRQQQQQQQSRADSASPSSAGPAALDESIVQQILASQGLLPGQPSHSAAAPSPTQSQPTDSALAQSILASMGNLYGTLAPDSPGRESNAMSFSNASRNQTMASPASAPELASNNRITGITSSMSEDQLRTLAAQLSGQSVPSESNATFNRRQSSEPASFPSNFQTAAQSANLSIMESLQLTQLQGQQQRGGRSTFAPGIHSLLPQQEQRQQQQQQQQEQQSNLLWLLSGNRGSSPGIPSLASQVAAQRLMPSASSRRFDASSIPSERRGDEKDSREQEGDSKAPH